jgi:hypothetical protein
MRTIRILVALLLICVSTSFAQTVQPTATSSPTVAFVLWFVKTSRTDKRFPPRGVCLLIQDSLLCRCYFKARLGQRRKRHPNFCWG